MKLPKPVSFTVISGLFFVFHQDETSCFSVVWRSESHEKIELFATRNDGDKLIERHHPETIRKNAAKFWNQRHFSVQNLVSRMKIGEF